MICFDRLSYTYPGSDRPALREVSLQIDEGEFVLVAGPSGSGKSTLLRCLNGLVPHFTGGVLSGRLTIDGHSPVHEGPSVLSRVVGFVFQDPETQFIVDRVEDEVAFALENLAVPREQMHSLVEGALDLLGLTSLRGRRLDALSGGEKQRVAIAAALILQAKVLVLDEPTSQLDPECAEDVLQALLRLNRELGLTIILAEHRLERIVHHCHRLVYVPDDGRPVLGGPPREVLKLMDLVPPVVTLGKKLGWEPLPLSVEEAASFASLLSTRQVTADWDSLMPHRDGSAIQPISILEERAEGVTDPGDNHQSDNGAERADHFGYPSRMVEKRPDHPPLLTVSDLSFSYGSAPTLDHVCFGVGEGELVVLMGRNGSGKTTLLRCLVGLLRAREGRIDLAGKPILGRDTADICRQIGYLPQVPDDLLFASTVAEELESTLRSHGKTDAIAATVSQLLQRLGLSDLASNYPRDLSVGQRQRVALGAVTVTQPRLLLLDEPTRGLDYRAKRDLGRLLQQWKAEGVGVLLVTHDVEFAAEVADRVIILNRGKIVADGPPADVLTISLPFAPQMTRIFPGSGWVTPEDVLAASRNMSRQGVHGLCNPQFAHH